MGSLEDDEQSLIITMDADTYQIIIISYEGGKEEIEVFLNKN